MKSTETCLTCQNYNKCNNPDKSFGFRCVSYQTMGSQGASLLLDMIAEDTLTNAGSLLDESLPVSMIGEEEAKKKETELIDYMSDIINNPNPIPKDLKFDDSDLKEFPNFYEWCMSSRGANNPPFARQLAIGIHLFGEYCPNKKCSSPRFGNIYTVPYKADPEMIADNVTFLRHGICPKCGARRSDLMRDGHLNLYDEFAGAIGQRGGKCLVAGTLLLTSNGLIPIEKVLSSTDKKGFTDYTGNLKVVLPSGKLAPISHNYVESTQPTSRVTLYNGMNVEGTRNHPMMTQRSWVTLKSMTLDDCFPISYGQNAFGKSVTNMKQANLESRLCIENTKSKTIKPTLGFLPKDSMKVDEDLAKLLGYWVSEGTGGRVQITNQDKDILLFCKEQLSRLYGADALTIEPNNIACRRYYANAHFNVLLGGALEARSKDKRVPDHILTSPAKIQSAFLSALYEGDGGVEGASVTYYSLSKELCTTLQIMLHNFGVICTLHSSNTWATNGTEKQISKKCWCVTIRGLEPLKVFEDRIGFQSSRKSKKLKDLISRKSSRAIDMPMYYDKLPQVIKNEFFQVLELVQTYLSSRTRIGNGNFKGSLKNTFGINSELGRIYYDNVALSKRRIISTFNTIRQSDSWEMVRQVIEPILHAFEIKYLQPNTYWVSVASVEHFTERKKTYDITVPKHHQFLANGLTSHNSAMFSQLAPYINHKYLKMQNPNRLFGQMENTVLSATFVGLTFARALSLLWTPVLNLMRTSLWYQDYHELLDFYGEKYGVVPYVIKDTFVDYRHRRLRLYPAGPNKRTLRGDTRYLSGIDEAGWFYSGDDDDEERERASGKEVHGALDRSLKTIRMATRKKILSGYDNLPGAYNISISSPSHNKDLIMYLTGLYENSTECLALRLPTWEFNPQYEGREDFKKEYAENAARAERDFGVNPQVNENRAYSQAEIVTIAERATGENLITVTSVAYSNKNAKSYTKPIVQRMVANDIPSVVSMDAGEVNNSFALTLIQRRDANSMPRVAGVIEVMPIEGTRINFNDMYTELLEELFRVYNVCGVVTDRWQSTAILNRIESEHGIYTKQVSAKASHFKAFDSYHKPEMLISYPRLEMPLSEIMAPSSDGYRIRYHNKPVAHLMHQFDTVQDINGVYDKGQGNTDDLHRSAVLGVNLITDPSFVEKYLKQKVRTVANSIGAIGSMGGMMGGYSQQQPSNIGASSVGAVGGSESANIGHIGASSLSIRR